MVTATRQEEPCGVAINRKVWFLYRESSYRQKFECGSLTNISGTQKNTTKGRYPDLPSLIG